MPLIVNQAKTIDGMLPMTMAEDSLNYGKEEYISFSVTSENTKHLDYILQNYFILALISFCINIFSKNKGLRFTKLFFAIFLIFLCFCKIPNNPIDSDLKTCSKTEFYTTESIKLQENLGNINRNSTLVYFAISKLRNKSIYFRKFYQILILLSGNVSLNPGPSQMQLKDDKIWKALITQGLHFGHLNVNSLLSKIYEIRDISNHIKPAMLGITESKLNSSVINSEVNINGYSIIRNDRNRNGGGVACYVRNDLCFNINVFSNSLEHVFFEILLPKVKPIAIGIFYGPPNVNNFLEILLNDFKKVDIRKKEIYILGNFNINLLQNGKFILKENQSNIFKMDTTSLINKYKEFCQTFSLTEIIKDTTRITCSTSSLLDHILTNSLEKISQKGTLDVSLSDHQLIYCTRKVLRIKLNMHNQIQVQSLKKYSIEAYTNALRKTNFPNYDTFSNINIAYTDLVKKISNTIDSVAPIKELRIKNNTQGWFDNEIADAINIRDKYFKKFKKSNLHIDYDFYIEAKCNVKKLIKHIKKEFYETKLIENIAKPKELWKTLKTMGLPSKKGSLTKICLEKDSIKNFDDKKNPNIFRNFYNSPADDLFNNLPPAPMRFGLHSVHQYYEKTLKLPHSNFKFHFVSEDYILKFLKNINEDKAAGIDNLSGKFLKDGAAVFAKPISQICNLSIKYSHFPMDCKIAKLKPLFKKGSRTARKNYRPISLLPLISKIIEKVIHDQMQKYLDDYNILYRYQSGFRKSYSTDSCLSYLKNKIATGFESGLYTGMIVIKKKQLYGPFLWMGFNYLKASATSRRQFTFYH